MLYIGIDVGGTGIQIGIVDEKGTIIEKGAIVTRPEEGYEKMIKDMADCALETLAKSGHDLIEIRSIGVGVPGIADQKTGVIPFCTNLGWHNVPFREEFQKHIDKPVYIDNDATVAALAESVAGVSAGSDSSVMLTLGTGVGGGIIVHGKIWSGSHGVGSEIGHMILELDGEPCTCGNRGCLERYCSATAIIRMAREAVATHPDSMILTMAGGDPAKINAKIVFDAAAESDPAATKVFRRYISYLAQAIASICNFFDPDVVVLGGGVSKSGDALLVPLREEVPKHVIFKTMPMARIEAARLGPDAGIIGAAMLGSAAE